MKYEYIVWSIPPGEPWRYVGENKLIEGLSRLFDKGFDELHIKRDVASDD